MNTRCFVCLTFPSILGFWPGGFNMEINCLKMIRLTMRSWECSSNQEDLGLESTVLHWLVVSTWKIALILSIASTNIGVLNILTTDSSENSAALWLTHLVLKSLVTCGHGFGAKNWNHPLLGCESNYIHEMVIIFFTKNAPQIPWRICRLPSRVTLICGGHFLWKKTPRGCSLPGHSLIILGQPNFHDQVVRSELWRWNRIFWMAKSRTQKAVACQHYTE